MCRVIPCTNYVHDQAAAAAGALGPDRPRVGTALRRVHPGGTAAGYRLYDDDAIARLIAMRHLVDGQGFRPSQAAERLLAGGTDVATLLEEAPALVRTRWPGPARRGRPGRGPRSGHAFVDAVRAPRRRDDGRHARRGVCHRAVRGGDGPRRVPCPARDRRWWADGSVDAAWNMRQARSSAGASRGSTTPFGDGGPPDVVVGLRPGPITTSGSWPSPWRHAGPDSRCSTSARTCRSRAGSAPSRRPARRCAVLGVVSSTDVGPAADVVAALRELPDGPVVRLGGAFAGRSTVSSRPTCSRNGSRTRSASSRGQTAPIA